MTGLSKKYGWLGKMISPRFVGMAATLLLAACASGRNPPPTAGTLAAEPPVAQAPVKPAVPGGALVKVGLLLPLSGPGANVGSEMLNAAQMALFDRGEEQFTLLPRDTKGQPAEAAEATRKLIADGARLILGPLFATEVDSVRPVARASNVNLLAFSNDWQRAGNGTYILGFVPADQVARIVGYARLRGLSRIAALAPRNPYGDAVIAALHESAQRQGIAVVREERYTSDNADLAGAVARLGAASAVASAPGAAPVVAPARALGAAPAVVGTRARVLGAPVAPAAAASPAAPAPAAPAAASGGGAFDALLIADAGERLKVIAPMLAANRIDPARVRLLGTSLWDDPVVAALPGVMGAWFAAPAPQARADFEGRFEGTYNHRPARLATLAYDATALAAVLARRPAASSFDATSLTDPSGFAGVDGIFRLRSDGLVERGLAVIEVSPQGPRVIDQAPTSFEAISSAR